MDIDQFHESENSPKDEEPKSGWPFQVLIALLSAIAGGTAQAVIEKLMGI